MIFPTLFVWNSQYVFLENFVMNFIFHHKGSIQQCFHVFTLFNILCCSYWKRQMIWLVIFDKRIHFCRLMFSCRLCFISSNRIVNGWSFFNKSISVTPPGWTSSICRKPVSKLQIMLTWFTGSINYYSPCSEQL